MKSCKNLNEILNRLEKIKDLEIKEPYYIPGLWDYKKRKAQNIKIDVLEYYKNLIKDYFYSHINKSVDNYLLPLSFYHGKKDWLNRGIIYCLDVRTASSWDHNGDGMLVDKGERITELGTFLKTMLLIPYLKELGIDILYLLPVLKTGKAYKKGELGSFYAIKNFYQLNEDLHDPLLDLPGDKFSVETEFKALIEACHIMGIRVIFDFPLRTASRDNDLIMEHPDWFYWIKKEKLPQYKVPYYHCLDVHVAATEENLQKIYPLPETLEYVRMFSHSPDKLNPLEWKEFISNLKSEDNILDLIEEKYGLTTAPAYADWINDPQPSWDDITFLRLYLDEPYVRKGYFEPDVPPFLFFDSIKTNWYQGKKPNKKLWEYLSGIIPYYQKNFGIDGARIDMAHALPFDLENVIISKALNYDSHFKFISEDLQHSNHNIARQKGYHSIIGEIWWKEGNLSKENLLELLDELPTLSIPSFACAETPDTPRAAIRKGGKVFSRLIGVLNFFLPNTIPFINNGFDLYEKQPMNLGLDNTEDGKYVLDKEDLYYGRLAFFDRFQLHWSNNDAEEIIELIRSAKDIRRAYSSLIDKNNFYLTGEIYRDVIEFGYKNQNTHIICLVNLNFAESKPISIKGEVLISSYIKVEDVLQPGEIRVIKK